MKIVSLDALGVEDLRWSTEYPEIEEVSTEQKMRRLADKWARDRIVY